MILKKIMPATRVQLIETVRVEPGRQAPLLGYHWRRLESSCQALGYRWPGAALVQAVQQRVEQLDAGACHRLRLLLAFEGQYSIETDPLPATPQPVRLHMGSIPLQADAQWLRHKTTHRPWYEESQRWLAENPGFFDVVFCNLDDEVCEGSRSNIYILTAKNEWLTPPVASGLLPGVQRQALLDEGRVREAVITRYDLLNARAIRVSNALRGWLDAVL